MSHNEIKNTTPTLKNNARLNLRALTQFLKTENKKTYRREVTKNLPIRATKKLNSDWQQEVTIQKLELELMKDPFEDPKYAIPSQVFTRIDKVIA